MERNVCGGESRSFGFSVESEIPGRKSNQTVNFESNTVFWTVLPPTVCVIINLFRILKDRVKNGVPSFEIQWRKLGKEGKTVKSGR